MSKLLEEVRSRLATLVAQPSVSCVDPARDMSNQAVIDTLADWFGTAGFATTVLPVADLPRKSDLVARLGEGSGGLVLSGHTDTVPWDADGWHGDPFVLAERDGRWYGLGSADMKCFFPIVLAALEGLDRARLRRPLTVLATADEESSMAGARVLADAGLPLGECALIGEPTSLVPVCRHKGIVIGCIRVRGRSGHSSNPALGASALDCMHDIMGDLRQWRAAAAVRFRDTAFEVPGPTLNLGRIRGGDSPNRICAECELHFDIRVVPALPVATALAEIEAIVRARAGAAGVDAELLLPTPPVPALDTAPDLPLVTTLEALSGARQRTVAFATEGPFLNALGCPSVVFGPGDIAVAHQGDEHVEVARVARMIDILRQLIERFCCHA